MPLSKLQQFENMMAHISGKRCELCTNSVLKNMVTMTGTVTRLAEGELHLAGVVHVTGEVENHYQVPVNKIYKINIVSDGNAGSQ